MTVSIQDIVKAADVSHSTSSRALRHRAVVDAKTARRMRHPPTEMSRVSSAIASGLVPPNTRSLGLALTAFSAPLAARIVRWAVERSLGQGNALFSSSTPDLSSAGTLPSIGLARESSGWRHQRLRAPIRLTQAGLPVREDIRVTAIDDIVLAASDGC